jgi:hypothetical protein
LVDFTMAHDEVDSAKSKELVDFTQRLIGPNLQLNVRMILFGEVTILMD